MKCRYSMDDEVRIGFLSMKCHYFMDVEVRIGFLSMKCRYFMDVRDWVLVHKMQLFHGR